MSSTLWKGSVTRTIQRFGDILYCTFVFHVCLVFWLKQKWNVVTIVVKSLPTKSHMKSIMNIHETEQMRHTMQVHFHFNFISIPQVEREVGVVTLHRTEGKCSKEMTPGNNYLDVIKPLLPALLITSQSLFSRSSHLIIQIHLAHTRWKLCAILWII